MNTHDIHPAQVLENFSITGPDADGLVWLILHGNGTSGRAMFNLGSLTRASTQVALELEKDRQAAIEADRKRRGEPVEKPYPVKLHAWGGVTRHHDYEMSDGSIQTLKDTEAKELGWGRKPAEPSRCEPVAWPADILLAAEMAIEDAEDNESPTIEIHASRIVESLSPPQPTDPSGTPTLHNTDSGAQNGIQATQPAEPAESSEPVGEAGPMPGTSGFTMACFRASEVPVGTKLYTAPQPTDPVTPHTQFEDARVQKVYSIICGDNHPPYGEHWDGYVSRLIVDALFPVESVKNDSAGYTLGPVSDGGMDPRNVPAEPVKILGRNPTTVIMDGVNPVTMPSEELMEFMSQFADGFDIPPYRFAEAARALLARYGKGTP